MLGSGGLTVWSRPQGTLGNVRGVRGHQDGGAPGLEPVGAHSALDSPPHSVTRLVVHTAVGGTPLRTRALTTDWRLLAGGSGPSDSTPTPPRPTGTPVNRIPIMAKQVLDLFMLYVLVTEKGGLVEVINKKLWREVTKGLSLPTSITSAAFTLRTQ